MYWNNWANPIPAPIVLFLTYTWDVLKHKTFVQKSVLKELLTYTWDVLKLSFIITFVY